MTVTTDRLAEDGVTRLLDMESSSRIQILNAPIQLPGVCGLCGTSRTDDRQYIDIGLWFEMYGQFYFCTFCMSEMVNRLGGLTLEQAEAMQDELDQARKAILEFQEEKAAYDGAIATLRSTGLFSDAAPYGPMATEQSLQSVNESSSGDQQTTIKPTSNSSKSSTKQRSNDIPSPGNNELDGWL